ncbi:DUF1566 domain-containing protein [bacterium]|nr:DUF1566 domain-containing protein [bacterium]
MKRCGSIFALFLMFFAVSCDNGLKFNNPNDKNSDAYRGGDADSEGTDDDAEPSGREQGGLYVECYPNKTCNEGLECDVLNNICKKDAGDSGDTEPTDTGDTEPTDTGDTEPADTGDTEPTDTGDTEPTDTGDSEPTDTGDTEPTDTGDTEPTDTGDTEPTDTGDTTPTEEEICAEAGGTYEYFAEDELTKCYKIIECDPKPANTEWRGEQSYTEYYDLDEGYWTHFGLNYSTEYGDTGEAKVCQYICAPGFDWNGTSCTAPSTPDNLTLGNICTGQTNCYNASSSMTCPSSSSADFFGQDAQYTNKCTAQSFTASSKVVVDNNTGLTWEKSPSSSTYTWANRNTHCNDLNSSNYGGKSNWRVPNPLELLSIVNNSSHNPATNSNFTNMPTDSSVWFWTSAEYKGNTSYAYAFIPNYGNYNGYASDSYSKTKTYKVLCVSGDEMQPVTSANFTTQTISGKVVVTDSKTGLMWQKEYVTGKTWQQALKYCEELTYAGYSDWRLPNKNELASLINYEKSGAPYSYFPDMPSYYFWSSSTLSDYPNPAWGVGFESGYVFYDYKSYSIYVRCVR